MKPRLSFVQVTISALLVALVTSACTTDAPALTMQNVLSTDGAADHACAVQVGGTVRCWGSNTFGQLGDSSTSPSGKAVEVTSLDGAEDVSAGSEFSCAVARHGSVACWGLNLRGQLGNGRSNEISTAPVVVPGLSGAMGVASGANHTCAVVESGRVACWGGNDFGQLGDGTREDRLVPTMVLGIDDAIAVSAGTGFSCAVLQDGSMRCWGLNSLGQLGDGSYDDSDRPVAVRGVDRVTALDSGLSTTCAVDAGGDVRCWGADESGQVGTVEVPAVDDPHPVAHVHDVTTVAVGERTACAVGTGRLWCWGGTTSTPPDPTPVARRDDLVALYERTVCVGERGGRLECRERA